MRDTNVSFAVRGTPIQEGNVSFGKGHSYHREGDRLTAWRDEVGKRAKEANRYRPACDGPVRLFLIFTLTRGKTVRRKEPTVNPDIDKLARGILDALKGVLYNDDAQVVQLEAVKRYEGMHKPGVSVTAYMTTLAREATA